MAHTKLLRTLCHDLNNVVAGVLGNLECMQLSDIAPGPSRKHYQAALESCERLCAIVRKAQTELYGSYRKSYTTYKGEPMLADKNGDPIQLHSYVDVPDPAREDLWENSFVGVVISTTKGDGLITVRDSADDCWDLDACKVELLKPKSAP
jgi:hypothetical protein